MKDSKVIIATTTFAEKKDAQKFSKKLISMKIIACAQIEGPISAMYLWENKLVEEKEWKVVMKFSKVNEEKVKSACAENHKYDVPQWVYWESKSSDGYARWVEDSA